MGNVMFLLVLMVIEFFVMLFILRFLISFLKKKNAVQHVREELIDAHKKKEGTPRGGGIVFLLSLLFLWPACEDRRVLFVTIAMLVFGAVGLVDDILTFKRESSEGLSIRNKLILFTLSSILLFVLFRDTFSSTVLFLGLSADIGNVFYFLLFLAIFTGSANAFNLTDGVDGLLGSVSCIMLVFFGVIAILSEDTHLFSLVMVLLVSLLAFLWYNSPKASIFMGDVGSSVLGGVVGALSIVTKNELYLPFVAIIPVIEAISIFIQISYFKLTHGKRVFKMTPIHHHFEILGWSESQVVFRFSIITVLFCLIVLFIKMCGL